MCCKTLNLLIDHLLRGLFSAQLPLPHFLLIRITFGRGGNHEETKFHKCHPEKKQVLLLVLVLLLLLILPFDLLSSALLNHCKQVIRSWRRPLFLQLNVSSCLFSGCFCPIYVCWIFSSKTICRCRNDNRMITWQNAQKKRYFITCFIERVVFFNLSEIDVRFL